MEFLNKGFISLTHLLTLVEVHTALELLGGVVNVVLQDELARHRPSSQLEPSSPPFLGGKIIFDSIIHWVFGYFSKNKESEGEREVDTRPHRQHSDSVNTFSLA